MKVPDINDINDKAMLERLVNFTESHTYLDDEDLIALGYVIGMSSRYREALKKIDRAATLDMAKQIAKESICD
jgi:hypothetical protein